MNFKFKSFFIILALAFACSFDGFAMSDAPQLGENVEEVDSDASRNNPKYKKYKSSKNFNGSYYYPGFNSSTPYMDINTPYTEVFQNGVKYGIYDGIKGTTKGVVANSLQFIPTGMSKLSGFMAAMLYKLSFGSRGLYVSDLAKINNRIYNLCLPFTVVSAGSMDRRRRANLIGEDNPEITLDDNNWQVVQAELVNELEHAVYYLEKSIPCYDLNKLKCSSINPKLLLAKTVHALSNEDHEEISYYILRAIVYLDKLIEKISGFTSFEDTQSKCEETKRWLSWALSSFEQVALFLDDTASMKSNNRIQFQRVNMQAGSAGGSSLDSLLGSLQNN